MPTGIYRTIYDLVENKTILPQKKPTGQTALTEFIEDFDSWYSHPSWIIASLTINLVGSFFISVPVHSVYKTWETANSFMFWYIVMFYWVVIYSIITLSALRYIITIIWLNRMFKRFQVNVRVLHPDGAGGLSPLGKFSVKTGYIIGLYGIASIWAMATEPYSINLQFSGFTYNPIILIWQIFFICLSPIVFFAPIGAAHASMKKAKESFITQISNRFEADMLGLRKSLTSDESSLDERIKKIKQLQELHDIASKFPVWPFNAANLIRFFSAVLSPVVLGLIPTFVDFVVK